MSGWGFIQGCGLPRFSAVFIQPRCGWRLGWLCVPRRCRGFFFCTPPGYSSVLRCVIWLYAVGWRRSTNEPAASGGGGVLKLILFNRAAVGGWAGFMSLAEGSSFVPLRGTQCAPLVLYSTALRLAQGILFNRAAVWLALCPSAVPRVLLLYPSGVLSVLR